MAGWGFRGNRKERSENVGKKKEDRVSREEFEEFKEWQGDINVDDAGAITELRRALAALTEQVEGLKGSSWPSSKETHWKHRAEAAEARARVKELEEAIRKELEAEYTYPNARRLRAALEGNARITP